MKKVQAYIAIRGSDNVNENADVPGGRMALYSRITRPVINHRVAKTRWCVLRWPTPSMAQAAGMSTEAFENLYFDVCTMDYRKMARAMAPLERLMRKTDRVRIKGPGTELASASKALGPKCARATATSPMAKCSPVQSKSRINGRIQFNTPSLYSGTKFENVCLEFKDGKIVNANSNNRQRLNEILDTDPGARYTGEFSLGVQSLYPESHVRYSVRRKNRRLPSPDTRPSLQRVRQRKPLGGALGTWCSSSAPNGAGARFGSTMNLSAKMGCSCPKKLKPLNPANLK